MKVEGKLETHKMNKRKILAAQVSRRSFLSSLGAAGVVATAGPAIAAAQTAPPMTSSDATSNESIEGAVPVSLRVNGKQLDPSRGATQFAPRLPARNHQPDRHQERLRPRPVRSLHGARKRPPHQLLPDVGRNARAATRSPPSKVLANPATSIPCRHPSSSTMATNAVTVPRASSCPPLLFSKRSVAPPTPT